MAEYTRINKENILDNITVSEMYRDGVLYGINLIAHEGYAIYDTTEELYTDPITGETYPPTYTYQVVLPLSVDYTIYVAIPITEGMEVVGGVPNPPQETI